MIETVKQVCDMLSRGVVKVSELASSLGKIDQAGSDSAPLLLKPTDTAFRAAEIVPGSPDAMPSAVMLYTAGSALLTLGALQAALGRDNPMPRAGRNQPYQTMFRYDIPTAPYTCGVIVRYEYDEDEDRRDSPVIALQCRRDPRVRPL